MGKKRIGINYLVSSDWIGGKYYLDSIINVLKEDSDNEIIYIKKIIRKNNLICKILKRFGFKKFFERYYDYIDKKYNLDFVYPYNEDGVVAKNNICWIPDFQHNHLPDFFSSDEMAYRDWSYSKIAYSDSRLVLSSNSAYDDFKRIHPNHKCKVFILPFISSLVGYQKELDYNVLEKYNISMPYFICSNQMWQHKNHITVLKALKLLKSENKKVFIIFTGKESDYRNPKYPQSLKDYVKDNELEDYVKFLGFISREDQVELMKKSIAVLQPSLFEGWNTTIEDAKVFGRLVIASAISVHKEQLGKSGIYFDPYDEITLSNILLDLYGKEVIEVDYEYENSIKKFKGSINTIFAE